VKEVFEKVKEINEKRKTAIVVVEHNLKSLLPICHRVYVLDKGKVVKEGTPDEITSSGIIEKVFLGKV
jgi:branched-chain amino acid transport system ATP-binding protein